MSSTPSTDQPRGPSSAGAAPHPLFPLERDATAETREIAYVTFQRRCLDGRVDNCPEDYKADEIRSWTEVGRRWGSGEYRVLGKDSQRRVVARHPRGRDEWVRCGQPSRPFVPVGASSHSRPMAAKPTLPRLRGISAESVALWATLCAEHAEREAATVGTGTLDSAFLYGCAAANRRIARRLLRVLAAQSLSRGAP